MNELSGNKLTILLVEDEKRLRQSISFSLKRYGYTVEAATDGETGLVAAREIHQRKNTIALLITDLQMPGLEGFTFIRMFRETWPDVPALIITGHDNGQVREKVAGFPNALLLKKPFDIEQLLAKVDSILDQQKRIKEDPNQGI